MIDLRIDDINALESESGVIATLIHHPDYIFYSEKLLPNHFTNNQNQLIYCAVQNLTKQGIMVIDPYNIIENLNSSPATKKFADELSIDQLNELVEISDVLTRHSVEEYKMLVDNVLNAAFRRDMYMCLRECEALCLSGSGSDVKSSIYRAVDEVMVEYTVRDDIPMFKDIVDEMWDRIKSKQGGGYAGIPFKIAALNDYVTIEKKELIIFGAQQKVGKSILLMNCAVDLMRQGLSVLYIDSELSTESFTSRLLSNLTGIKHRDIKSGNYSPEDELRLENAMEWLKTRNFTHIYMPFFDTDSIYSTVKQVHHIQPIDVLIIDYFKSTGDDKDAFQTYASMGKCVDTIKNEIAGAMDIAAIGAAQTTAYNKLADSAKIARNASTIVLLMDKDPDEIEIDGIDGGNKKLVVVYNRNGAKHGNDEWINLKFDGDIMRYEQAPVQHIPQTPY